MSRLPDPGQRVGVHVPEWNARLVSEVLAAGVGTVAIAFPSDGRSAFGLPAGIALALEWVNPRGLVRVEGRSGGHDEGSGVQIQLSGSPEVVQRRDYVRANTVVDVVVTPLDGLTMPARGLTIDVSGGGLQASLPGLDVDVEDRVRIELDLPDEPGVEAEARVTRVPGSDTFCFVFEQIDPREQERLIKFVFQRLRGSTGKAA